MSTIWQTTKKELTNDIKTLLDQAGALDWLGPENAVVLLKPNLVVSKPASGGATTHPEIVGGIIEYLLANNYRNIAIAEGSWVGDKTSRAFKVCGYSDLARRYGIRLIDLQQDTAESRFIDGEEYRICSTIAEAEKEGGSLINIPVLKGHGQTLLTCALKNLKGCIPNSEKRRYHSLGVHDPVAILNTIIKPAFTLVDGLNGDPYWEEGGSPERRDLLLLGRDSVSIDSYACELLGIPVRDVPYIGIAESLGVGVAAAKTDIVNLDTAAYSGINYSTGKIETRNWINLITDQRSACSACFGNLAAVLRELKETHPDIAGRFDNKAICIGQDFQDQLLPEEKTGIGSCTSGMKVLKGCPPSQAAISEFLKDIRASN